MRSIEIRAWKENGNPLKYRKMLDSYAAKRTAWEKRHPLCIYQMSDPPPLPPSAVSYNKDGINLHIYPHPNNVYPIGWWQIEERGTLWWVHHIAAKPSVTGRVIKDFIECAENHFGRMIG